MDEWLKCSFYSGVFCFLFLLSLTETGSAFAITESVLTTLTGPNEKLHDKGKTMNGSQWSLLWMLCFTLGSHEI